MTSLHRMWVCVLITVPLSSPVWAQRSAPQAAPPDDWGHGTTVSASVGVAADGSATGAAAGGAVAWELTPRVLVEGSGVWLDRREGSHAFNAALKVRAGLTRGGVSPFVEGGVGLYRVTSRTSAPMPGFYQRRLASQGAGLTRQVFTDPVFQVGAGVNVFASRHLSLQPAVEALVVTRDAHAYTLTVFSLRLAYHFEDHPVTR